VINAEFVKDLILFLDGKQELKEDLRDVKFVKLVLK